MKPPSTLSILNQAAGGNRILSDLLGRGPNVLARLDRDALTQSGVKYIMIAEGINDIGQDASYTSLIQGYEQVIMRVHSFGLPIFGATITPFCGRPGNEMSDPIREKVRYQVNDWIRNSGKFDAVMDFAIALQDPEQKNRLNDRFDTGDCVHPNSKGQAALAQAFDMEVFERFKHGVRDYVGKVS